MAFRHLSNSFWLKLCPSGLIATIILLSLQLQAVLAKLRVLLGNLYQELLEVELRAVDVGDDYISS